MVMGPTGSAMFPPCTQEVMGRVVHGAGGWGSQEALSISVLNHSPSLKAEHLNGSLTCAVITCGQVGRLHLLRLPHLLGGDGARHPPAQPAGNTKELWEVGRIQPWRRAQGRRRQS